MRIKLLLIFFAISLSVFSQDSITIIKADTLLPFFGKKSLNLHGYENRIVPYESFNPLYVLISYEGVETKHFEYFRIDSSKYLLNEFFRSKKGSSNEGLKASGVVHVIDKILDSSASYGSSASSWGNHYCKQTHYYKGFSKEGDWDEYEDSLYSHKYWRGKYKNNHKVGIWSNYIYDPNEDRLIMQINYDEDSTLKLFSLNIASWLSLDSIMYFLNGRWTLACEDDKDKRIFMNKCQLYNGHYGDNCNNRFGKENYYEFLNNSRFTRQKGETCDKFKQNSTSGQWKVLRDKNQLMIHIKLTTGYTIKYKVLYLDRDGIMIADRQ